MALLLLAGLGGCGPAFAVQDPAAGDRGQAVVSESLPEAPAPVPLTTEVEAAPVASPAPVAVAPELAPSPAPLVVAPVAAPAPATAPAPVVLAPAPPATGLVEVANGRHEPLLVVVDGVTLGQAAPRALSAFADVLAGERRLLVSRTDGQVLRSGLVFVPAGGAVRWELAAAPVVTAAPLPPAGCTLRLANRSAAAYSVFLDGRQLAVVAPGTEQSTGALLQPGRLRLEARPLEQGWPVRREELFCPGATPLGWIVPPARLAALDVANATGRTLRLSLDGRRLGRLAAGEVRRFAELRPGVRELRADEPGRPDHVASLLLVSGEVTRWELQRPAPAPVVERPALPRPARLTLVNRASEPLTLSVEGRAEGVLRSGEQWRGELRPGRAVVEARGLQSGEPYRLELRLRPGDVQQASFEPRFGGLALANRSDQAVRLLLDGRSVGRLLPGQRTDLARVSLGDHRLAVRGERNGDGWERTVTVRRGTVERFEVTLAPSQPRHERRPEARGQTVREERQEAREERREERQERSEARSQSGRARSEQPSVPARARKLACPGGKCPTT